MATIQKQCAEKKGRKRFKKLFCQIRNQVIVLAIIIRSEIIATNFLHG